MAQYSSLRRKKKSKYSTIYTCFCVP